MMVRTLGTLWAKLRAFRATQEDMTVYDVSVAAWPRARLAP